MSLRVKLLLSYVLVVAVTLVSVVWIARQGALREVGQFMTSQGMVEAPELVSALEAYYRENGGWQGVETVLVVSNGHGYGGMMGGQRLLLADTAGLVVYGPRGEEGTLLSQDELAAASLLRDAGGKTVGYLLAESGMMGGGLQAGRNLLARLTTASVTAALIGGGLALLVALFVGYQLLKPVGALTRAARGMAAGDLGQQVEARGSDELAELGRAFNRMAQTLQRSEQNRRSMTADIAHELRTPIAVQRAHLEALQDGVYALTAENLQPVLDQTELLAHLVEDLRTLALADAGELHLDRRNVHLSELARRVAERFRAEADNRQVGLLVDTIKDSEPEILVDARRIEQILNNLVGNALRYTPVQGQIRLSIQWQEKTIALRVMDTGPGIPADALDHLFERFYRADRSRNREEGGTGLGLAIARQLALAHRGELRARNRSEGGAEFILELPLA